MYATPMSSFGVAGNVNSEIDKYIYVHLKLLNFVEVAYIENRIDDETYRNKTGALMNKINTLKIHDLGCVELKPHKILRGQMQGQHRIAGSIDHKNKSKPLDTQINRIEGTLKGQIPGWKIDEFFLNYGLQSLNFAYSKLNSTGSSGNVEKKYQMQMVIYDKAKNFLLKMEAKAFEDPSIRPLQISQSCLVCAGFEQNIKCTQCYGIGNVGWWKRVIRHFTTDLAEIVSLLQRAKDENYLQDNVINGLGSNLRTHSDNISRRDVNELLSKDEIADLCILVDDIIKNLKRMPFRE